MDLMKTKEVGNELHYYGYSLGANAVLDMAMKLKIDKIILISPRPLFKDTYRRMGEKKGYVRDYLLDKTLTKSCDLIVSKVDVYVGELESDYSKGIAKKIAFNLGEEVKIIKGYEGGKKLFDYVYKKN